MRNEIKTQNNLIQSKLRRKISFRWQGRAGGTIFPNSPNSSTRYFLFYARKIVTCRLSTSSIMVACRFQCGWGWSSPLVMSNKTFDYFFYWHLLYQVATVLSSLCSTLSFILSCTFITWWRQWGLNTRSTYGGRSI